MPSFETGVVLHALIDLQMDATIGPHYLGPQACAEFASKLRVPEYQLWGALCNLMSEKRIDMIQDPRDFRRSILVPTARGDRYYKRGQRKQPYDISGARRHPLPV